MSKIKTKVAIVGTNGIPAQYGGAETLVEHITRELSDDIDFLVYCSKTQKTRQTTHNGARLKYLPLKANGWQSFPYDIYSIFEAAKNNDVVFLFGGGSGFVFPILRLFNKRVRIIVNHGGLNEWERGKYSSLGCALIKFGHKVSSRVANVNITDNNQLRDSLLNNFGSESIVVRYGGDHAKSVDVNDKLLEKYPFLNKEYYVSVSRAQEDNNLHVVLDAFKGMLNKNLVMVANWNISEYGKNLKKEYLDKYSNIILLDAIYVPEEINAIRSNATAYIHSHSYCGTAPSLVEAMNLFLPIISFDVPTNRETTQGRALYFVDSESLKAQISSISDMKLLSIGQVMGEIAKRDYTWAKISKQYLRILK